MRNLCPQILLFTSIIACQAMPQASSAQTLYRSSVPTLGSSSLFFTLTFRSLLCLSSLLLSLPLPLFVPPSFPFPSCSWSPPSFVHQFEQTKAELSPELELPVPTDHRHDGTLQWHDHDRWRLVGRGPECFLRCELSLCCVPWSWMGANDVML